MNRIEDFLTKQLERTLSVSRILTVFDPNRHLLEVVRKLASDQCRLIEVDNDIINSRENAMEALADLGCDTSHTHSLVLYIPRPKPLEPEAVCSDPFAPLMLAGGVFPDGAGDDYLALCQRFLPEQSGVIEEMFLKGEPTFAEINSLVSGGEAAPVLSGLLDGEGTKDLLVRFLCQNDEDASRLKKSPHWHKELGVLVKKSLGLELPDYVTEIDELKLILWRFILFSEFSADLPVDLPAALSGVPKAEAKYHRFVFDLCSTLRDRTSAQEAYEEYANKVAKELGLESHCDGIQELGVLDTFAFEERSYLKAFGNVVLASDLEKASALVDQRSKSFWIRDPDRAAEWKLAGCCIEVLQLVDDVWNAHKELEPKTVGAWMDFQTQQGYRLDTTHRVMEQVAGSLIVESESLTTVLEKARTDYRELVDLLTRKFQECVGKEGWPASGRIRSNEIYDRYVSTPWKEGKKVAYFWVDALRYEAAKVLASSLSDRHQVTVDSVCAQLPTITKIGMAALLPGANEDFRLDVIDGDLVPSIKGRSLANLTQRTDYMRECIGANRFECVDLAKLLSSKNISDLAKAEVLVVRTTDIDKVGESNPEYLATLFPGMIRELQVALNKLADAGFSVAVLGTDHGFCWFDKTERGDAIQKPAGEWVEAKNRALLGSGQPGSQVNSFDASSVGIRGDITHYVVPKGLATFTKGVRYFHEGLSLQECVLPVLQVTLKASAPRSATAKTELFLTYRGAKSGTVTTLRPSIEISMPTTDLFALEELVFALEGYTAKGVKVASAGISPAADAGTGELRMSSGQSHKVPIRIDEGFEGEFELRATNPSTGEIYSTLKLKTDFHH